MNEGVRNFIRLYTASRLATNILSQLPGRAMDPGATGEEEVEFDSASGILAFREMAAQLKDKQTIFVARK